MQRGRSRHGHVDGGDGAEVAPLDSEVDDRRLPAEGDDVTARDRAAGPPDFTQIIDGVEFVIPVSVVDDHGTEVVHADITCWVTPA